MMGKYLRFCLLTIAAAVSIPVGAQISGGGSFNPAGVAITGGTINGTAIGGTTPAAVSASTLTTPSAAITGGTINGTTIGATTAATVKGTSVTGTSLVSTGTASVSSTLTIGTDAVLLRDASNTLAMRNGTNPQGFRIYNNFTDASNYELAIFDWTSTSNWLSIGTEALGTGTVRNLTFVTGGLSRWNIDTTGHLYPNLNGSYSIGQNTLRPVQVYFQALAVQPPSTYTGTTYTVTTNDANIIANGTANSTITLPAASLVSGRTINIKTTAAFTVVSASANIVPLVGGTAATAILAATAGKWAQLVSDGTNWIIMEAN